MTENKPDWAEYKRKERGHKAGDHFRCEPNDKCPEATRLYQANQGRLLFLAVFDHLKTEGINAVEFFGSHYGQAKRMTELDIPEYPYLDREPDWVTRMEAKVTAEEAAQLLEHYQQYVEQSLRR